MKSSKKITYECAVCGGPTSILHELIYGNGNRKVSEEYNIQAPLCMVCHGAAHDKWTPHGHSPLYRFRMAGDQTKKIVLDVKAIARHLCEEYLKIDYWDTLLGVKTQLHRAKLIRTQYKCKKIIEKSIICKE
jgi:hypothetical protein